MKGTKVIHIPKTTPAGASNGEPVVDPAEAEDQLLASQARYTISSYGADYPVDGLVKRLGAGDIVIPDYQRGYVWTYLQASKFVESLLLGLPVPGIFLFKNPRNQKLIVVDGQQRLESLRRFYDGRFGDKVFKLSGVSGGFEEREYKSLAEDDRRRLDDSVIHATIIRQEEPENDDGSIYEVFNRLNTGGTALSAQEIRTALYRGEFCDLLRDLNEFQEWRKLYGPKSTRGKDQEMILRFFALYFELAAYKRPMRDFLTLFMSSHQNIDHKTSDEYRDIFARTVKLAVEMLGSDTFRPERALNLAVTDAILVGVARALQKGDEFAIAKRKHELADTVSGEVFLNWCTVSTTTLENIRSRIEAVENAVIEP